MNSFSVTLASGILAAAMGSMAPAHSSQVPLKPANLTGLHDFDFLVGEWRVRHRYLRAATHEWLETDGTCSNRGLMDGWANMDEHTLNAPSGAYRAIGLRAYDPTTGQWSIWWLDGRYPSAALDPPLKGRFENGIGTFFVDDTLDGRPIRKRFIWSHISPTSARWEQAFSHDAGKTWESNWIMEFRRGPSEHSSQAAANPAGLHDFDFLVGDWRVHHRRVKADSHDWVEFDGTCSNRALMKGWANMEEHTLNAPSGAYRAVGLRAYDPKTGQWAIWWLDGRYPSGALDPPVKGHFEAGVGTFYSDYMDKGKPMRVRFIWSHITPTSARWQQASSPDAGKTWETNWIMEFSRGTGDPGSFGGADMKRMNPGGAARPAGHVEHLKDFPVVEFRRYTLKEGEREPFACYFESFFPEAFQQIGAIAFGQFFERGNPNRFTWIRGFHSTEARGIGNAAFYYGPLWKEHAATMNDRMVDSDDVLLLRPLSTDRGIPVLPAVDPVSEASRARGVVVAEIFPVKAGNVEAFAQQMEPTFAAYRASGVREAGVLVTLDGRNTFPQLPVRADVPYLVWLGVVEDNRALETRFTSLLQRSRQSVSAEGLLRGEPELVVLDPTSRSRLRWLPQ